MFITSIDLNKYPLIYTIAINLLTKTKDFYLFNKFYEFKLLNNKISKTLQHLMYELLHRLVNIIQAIFFSLFLFSF